MDKLSIVTGALENANTILKSIYVSTTLTSEQRIQVRQSIGINMDVLFGKEVVSELHTVSLRTLEMNLDILKVIIEHEDLTPMAKLSLKILIEQNQRVAAELFWKQEKGAVYADR